MTDETSKLLMRWAVWARQDQQALGFPSLAPFVVEPSKTPESLSDDQAGPIDAAVAQLIKRNEETGRAIYIYFFSGCNISHTARSLDMDRRKANVLVQSGIAWIDAILSLSEAA